MDKLLRSRNNETQERLGGLSPEKYGKGAYCDLAYTPSKLADNVLYKDSAVLRRIQEESTKNRSFEALNHCLADKVKHLTEERDGITASLNQQILMYKRIISEVEQSMEARINEAQARHADQLQKIISDKEEEAKFAQSERQLLESKIQELEGFLDAAQQKLQSQQAEVDAIRNEMKAKQDLESVLNAKIIQLEGQKQNLIQEAAKTAENHTKQVQKLESQRISDMAALKAQSDKDLEMQSRLHYSEIEKLSAQRLSDLKLKEKEMHEMINRYEQEAHQMSDLLVSKDRAIDNLSYDLKAEKAGALTSKIRYQDEIQLLSRQKEYLSEEVKKMGLQSDELYRSKRMATEELTLENSKLRELLMESSVELQRCKEEFIALGRENQVLILKLRDREEEAKSWRDSYYINKKRLDGQ